METTVRPNFPVSDVSVRIVSLSASGNIATGFAGGQNEHALVAMLEGRAEIIFDDEILTISPAFIAFINGGYAMRTAENVPAKLWIVKFTDRFASESLYSVNASAMVKMFTPKYYGFYAEAETFKIIKKLLLLLDRHQGGMHSKNSEAICRITFNLLCNCLQEDDFHINQPDKAFLNRKESISVKFLTLVTDNAVQHHDVKFYADKLCMTRGNLGKIIKEVTGKAPKTIIEGSLVSIAIELLEGNPESINNLSEILGFKSPSAFISFFRLHTGSSPNDYRNRNRKHHGNS